MQPDKMNGNYFITTFSGKKFYFDKPEPRMVSIYDIADALAGINRFGGHLGGGRTRFYSVAQHSVAVSRVAEVLGVDALWALMHDAAEAYVGDMVGPLKRMIPEFKEIENRVLKVIEERFQLDPAGCPLRVKEIDMHMMCWEGLNLTTGEWPTVDELPPAVTAIDLAPLSPEQGSSLFLDRFTKLTLGRRLHGRR